MSMCVCRKASPAVIFGAWLLVFILLVLGGEPLVAQSPLVTTSIDDYIVHTDWSPDGQVLAVSTETTGKVIILDGSLQQVAEITQDAPDWFTWSPDGTRLATVGAEVPNVSIWNRDLTTNTFTLETTLPPESPELLYVWSASWSPDGTQLAVIRISQPSGEWGIKGIIEIVNTQTWQVETVLQEDRLRFPGRALEWSPDSTRIAATANLCPADELSSCESPIVLVIDKNSGLTLWKQTDPITSFFSLSWSPDGAELAVGVSELFLNDAATGQQIARWDLGTDTLPHVVDWSPDGTKLAAQGGQFPVMIIDIATGATLLSFHTGDGFTSIGELAWSPDGSKLVIESGKTLRIWDMSSLPDVSGTPTITPYPTNTPTRTPTPSPTPEPLDEKIAFTGEVDDEFGSRNQIFTIDLDGSNLVNISNNAFGEEHPAWSPDGSEIAYVSDRDGDSEIYVMHYDGSNPQRLTVSSGLDDSPTWSPDGSQIAFVSDRDGNEEIYVMDVDGTNVQRLTSDGGRDYAPDWSPDGSEIAFTSDRNGNDDIYIMNVDGTNARQITLESYGADFSPAWSPDGSQIAFVYGGGDGYDVYVMDVDGSNRSQLTFMGAAFIQGGPAWSPDGSQIVYDVGFVGEGTTVSSLYIISADGYYQAYLSTGESLTFTYDPAWTAGAFEPPEPTATPTVTPTVAPIVDKILFTSRANYQSQIFMMDMDGSNVVNLSNNAFNESDAVWSPDGLQIAFASDRNEDGQHIYTMNNNGTNITQLTFEGYNSSPTWSPNGSQIAFVSDRYGDEAIFVMDTDGANVTQLTASGERAYAPDWSPTGLLNRIVFVSDQDGDEEIFVMDADGSNVTQVTFNEEMEFDPAWSADGTRIAFISTRRAGEEQIYIMNADGSTVRRLTTNGFTEGSPPDWSPDGTQIIFASGYEGNFDIYRIDADGSNEVKLLTNGADNTHPIWALNRRYLPLPTITPTPTATSSAPVAEKIAFAALVDDENGYRNQIFVMNPDGSELTNLSNNSYSESDPAWSPDGSQIVFTSDESGDIDIYVMNADGSNVIQLTYGNYPYDPSWSPDGTQIVFVADGGDDEEIYIMDADGSNIHAITASQGRDYAPDWSPDGTQIIFSSERDGSGDIFVMNADGSNVINLTSGSYDYDILPAWSPDGTQIVFVSDRDDYHDEIFIMDANGSNVQQVTSNYGYIDGAPDWSPDGNQIVFSSDHEYISEIYTVNTGGSNQTRLTNDDNYNFHPSWLGSIPLPEPTSTPTATETPTETPTDTPTETATPTES